jgi:hypothetical protein
MIWGLCTSRTSYWNHAVWRLDVSHTLPDSDAIGSSIPKLICFVIIYETPQWWKFSRVLISRCRWNPREISWGSWRLWRFGTLNRRNSYISFKQLPASLWRDSNTRCYCEDSMIKRVSGRTQRKKEKWNQGLSCRVMWQIFTCSKA